MGYPRPRSPPLQNLWGRFGKVAPDLAEARGFPLFGSVTAPLIHPRGPAPDANLTRLNEALLTSIFALAAPIGIAVGIAGNSALGSWLSADRPPPLGKLCPPGSWCPGVSPPNPFDDLGVQPCPLFRCSELGWVFVVFSWPKCDLGPLEFGHWPNCTIFFFARANAPSEGGELGPGVGHPKAGASIFAPLHVVGLNQSQSNRLGGGASQANRRRRGRGKDSSGMYSSQAVGVKTSQTGIRRGVVLGLGHMEASRGGGKPWVRGQLTTSHGHFNFSFSLAHLFSFTSPHRCQPREVVPSGGGGEGWVGIFRGLATVIVAPGVVRVFV